jgi:hypothetical protein
VFQFTFDQVMAHQMLYTVDEINQVLATNMIGFSIAGIMVYLIGFLQYGTSLYIQSKDRKSPWYLFMHAYYFGHDFTFVLSFQLWFQALDFWLFKVLWAGCIVFCFIEFYSLYMTVKNERQEIFGRWFGGREVSTGQAWAAGLIAYLLGFLVFYLLRIGLGDTCCLFLMMSTNWMVAVFPLFITLTNKERHPRHIVLAILVIVGTCFTFSPEGIGFWATAAAAFRGPWFLCAGAIALVFSIVNTYAVLRLPKAAKQGK